MLINDFTNRGISIISIPRSKVETFLNFVKFYLKKRREGLRYLTALVYRYVYSYGILAKFCLSQKKGTRLLSVKGEFTSLKLMGEVHSRPHKRQILTAVLQHFEKLFHRKIYVA